MAKQTINVGTNANDGTGDTIRSAFQKSNANFTELYDAIPQGLESVLTESGLANLGNSEVIFFNDGEENVDQFAINIQNTAGTVVSEFDIQPSGISLNSTDESQELSARIELANGEVKLKQFALDGVNDFSTEIKAETPTANTVISFPAKVAGNYIVSTTDDLTDYQETSERGVANGYVPTNASNKIDLSFLPDAILGQLIYGGAVNATTAVATLTNNAKTKLGTASASITLTNNTAAVTGYVANEGIFYIATTAGTFASITFEVGDWLISTGSSWTKVDNTDAVSSVAGRTGVVVLTKSDVDLANADNTSDANKPVSTAQQTALNLKANLSSPTFTGTPLAPTPTAGDNSTKIATTAYVDALVTEYPETAYNQTITFTAGTVPSGTLTANYRATRIGKCVSVRLSFVYTVLGATITNIFVPFPSGLPQPSSVTGFNSNGDSMGVVNCIAFSAKNNAGVATRGLLRRVSTGVHEIVISVASSAYLGAHVDFQYFID